MQKYYNREDTSFTILVLIFLRLYLSFAPAWTLGRSAAWAAVRSRELGEQPSPMCTVWAIQRLLLPRPLVSTRVRKQADRFPRHRISLTSERWGSCGWAALVGSECWAQALWPALPPARHGRGGRRRHSLADRARCASLHLLLTSQRGHVCTPEGGYAGPRGPRPPARPVVRPRTRDPSSG